MAASRKLYTELAVTIRRHFEGEVNASAKGAIEALTRDIALDLKQDNMAFNSKRFLDACGI